MAHAAGCRSTARSIGVHEVHRHRMVDRPIDRCMEAVDRSVDRLKGAKSRLETVDRRGRLWHGSVDRQTRFLQSFKDSDSFSVWDRIQSGFPKTQELCAAINKGQSPHVLYP